MANLKSILLVILCLTIVIVGQPESCQTSLETITDVFSTALSHVASDHSLDELADSLTSIASLCQKYNVKCKEASFRQIYQKVKDLLPKSCTENSHAYLKQIIDKMNISQDAPVFNMDRVTLFELRKQCTDKKVADELNHNQNLRAEPTFDFMAPFKDYNNKISLSVKGMTTGVQVVLISNFHPNMGWGECFGQGVYSLSISTVQKGSSYETTIVNTDSKKTFDLTKTCDIMGTNSGEALVLPGVAVPIVTSVTIDGTKLKIFQPSQKDPGNGFKIGGYYAQWAVWGRQFDPYNIPFDSINQIFYAFVGFNSGDGSVKTLDSAADGWGLSAIARAMLQYPYLQAHLSFGGWTNNGQTTAPMFEQLASSQSSIDRFCSESINLMRKVGFTGIDIDWQWWSDYGDNVAPAKKMLNLFKSLRKALDDASKKDGKKYKISAAVNGGSDRILSMQSANNPNSVADFWKEVASAVDQLNIMSYDYHGGYDVGNPAYFHATYDFQNTGNNKVGKEQGWSIKSSVETYINNGLNCRQLVVGIPLYARTMQVSSGTDGGLFAKVIGTGFGDYEKGIFDYKCLMNPVANPLTGCGSSSPISGIKSLKFYNSNTNTQVWNLYGKDALQPWAYSSDAATFVTFDDVWSTTQKVKMTRSKNLLGVMFWELDGDTLAADQSLIRVAKNNFNALPSHHTLINDKSSVEQLRHGNQ